VKGEPKVMLWSARWQGRKRKGSLRWWAKLTAIPHLRIKHFVKVGRKEGMTPDEALTFALWKARQ